MAVMASPQPEAAVVDQKLKMASVDTDEQTASGNHANGHASPSPNGIKSPGDDPMSSQPEIARKNHSVPSPDLDSNHTKNSGAFASNQAVASEGDGSAAEEQTQISNAPREDVTMADTALDEPPAEVELAPKPQSEIDKDTVEAALKTDESKTEPPKSESPADAKTEDADADMADAPPVISEVVNTPPAKEFAKPSDPAASEVKETPAESTSVASVNSPPGATQAEDNTRDRPVEDVKADKQPAEKVSQLNPPSMSELAIDAPEEASVPQESSTLEATDVAMSDSTATEGSVPDTVSQLPKVAREREDDIMDAPAAKRARTEPSDTKSEIVSEMQLTTAAQSAPDTTRVEDSSQAPPPAMTSDVNSTGAAAADLDVPADEAAVFEAKLEKLMPSIAAKPGSVMHPDSEGERVTEHISREMRKYLGQVKKTKAGSSFKDSVRKMWPALADAYETSIQHPMDLGLIERNLRNGLYPTIGDFNIDVKQIIRNTCVFNGFNHEVTAQATSMAADLWGRLAACRVEAPKGVAQRETKTAATRHAEPRTQPRPKPAPVAATAPPAPVAASSDKVALATIHAAPPVPPSRRDSILDDDRPKRPIHPPRKELGYEAKGSKRKKLSADLKFCDTILKDLQKPKYGDISWIFAHAVDEVRDGAPGYYATIKNPMDLATIGNKLQVGQYRSADDFKADIDLMLKNAFTFNPPGTNVYKITQNFEDWFSKRWSGIDAHVAKAAARAPTQRASGSSPSAGLRDDSDDEGPASDPEPSIHSEEIAALKKKIDALESRILIQTKEYTEEVSNMTDPSDTSHIDVLQNLIQVLTADAKEKRKALAELEARVPPPRPKSTKAKKVTAAPAATKKAAGSKKSGASGGKKAGSKRIMSSVEKEAIANGINELDGTYIEQAVAVIKKDTNQEENGDGELELEIEQLSIDALNKLYDIMCQGIKGFKSRVDSLVRAAQASAPPAPETAVAGQSQKRKNKPMNSHEQEAKLQKLRELKDIYASKGRQNSGSQEPPAFREAEEHAGEQDDSEPSSEED